MRLSESTRGQLSAEIAQPRYERSAQGIGIVHFGIGAFHRSHQAWYTDACMNSGERGWGIAGVSLRSPAVSDQLTPQDGYYTLSEKSADGTKVHLIGSVREVLVGQADRAAIVERIAAPECRIVSFTVTEKGYCRAAEGTLDREAAGLGFYPLLEEALDRRRSSGAGGITLLTCDNLSENGRRLKALVSEWLSSRNEDLAAWFAGACTCPNTMVDRIVPATSAADLAAIERGIGLRDEGAVVAEPFSQWVIEDDFAGDRPRWEKHGAQLVSDVAPYETAKLRMLNGAHSALAYCGLDRRNTYVHEAIADPALHDLVRRLMCDEAKPTIAAGPDQDLADYADKLLARFANPALNHRLEQIAMDGSQKIPQRWLETLAANRAVGRSCPAIVTAFAHWLLHIRGDRRTVDDPLAVLLREASRSGSVAETVDRVLKLLPGSDRWRPEIDELELISETWQADRASRG